jgi:ubiquinone/menaquinone biosynthesis C-methylase UbiE
MMERIPEPELMNEEEQAKAYAFADFSVPHNLFIETFQEKFIDLNSAFNDVILDLGCGPCDVTRRFAKAYPDAGFHAVDGAAEMLKYAVELNEQASLSPRIKLIETCLPNVELPQSFYHAIISNSLLHHLHDPFVLWETIQKYAKPYAHVFVMDLIRPVDEQTVDFLSNEYAANEPEILKSDFENSLRAAYTVKEVRQQLDEMGLGNLQVEEASDRHMIIYGIL